MTKITMQLYTDDTCGTKSTATNNNGDFITYVKNNKNANGKFTASADAAKTCFMLDKAADGAAALNWGATCIATKFTIEKFLKASVKCDGDVQADGDLKNKEITWNTCVKAASELDFDGVNKYSKFKATTSMFATGAQALQVSVAAAAVVAASLY